MSETMEEIKSKQLPTLPADLESSSLARFDELLDKGQLLYEPLTTEAIEDQGFKVSRRYSLLTRKTKHQTEGYPFVRTDICSCNFNLFPISVESPLPLQMHQNGRLARAIIHS